MPFPLSEGLGPVPVTVLCRRGMRLVVAGCEDREKFYARRHSGMVVWHQLSKEGCNYRGIFLLCDATFAQSVIWCHFAGTK